MAVSLLGFNRKGPQIGSIRISCSVQEKHRSSAQVTEFPIESGHGITDHIRINQDQLSLHGIITDASMTAGEALSNGIGGATGFSAAGPQEKTGIDFIDNFGKNLPDDIQTAYAKLKEMVDQGSVFKVITGLRVYDNMAFTSFEVSRDKRTGRVLDFQATLQAVQFVFAQRTPIRSIESATVTAKKGQMQVKPSTAVVEDKPIESEKSVSLEAFQQVGVLPDPNPAPFQTNAAITAFH